MFKYTADNDPVLLLLQTSAAPNSYAIVINAYSPSTTRQGSLSDTSSQHLSQHPQSSTHNNLKQHAPLSLQRAKQLWSTCNNKLRSLTSKQPHHPHHNSSAAGALQKSQQQYGHRPAVQQQQLVSPDCYLDALREALGSWVGRPAGGASNCASMAGLTDSAVSTASSGRSSHSRSHSSRVSTAGSGCSSHSSSCSSGVSPGSLDYSHVHLLLRGSPSCLVLTPEAMTDQARHWQHAITAMDALSNWWKV
jgi:hypothetical protein